MFELHARYLIDNKRYRYAGKCRDREYHLFINVINQEDEREVSIFASTFLYEIQRTKIG